MSFYGDVFVVELELAKTLTETRAEEAYKIIQSDLDSNVTGEYSFFLVRFWKTLISVLFSLDPSKERHLKVATRCRQIDLGS